MKMLSVALAVVIMLAVIFLQKNSASPVSGRQELEEAMDSDNPVAACGKTFEESWKMPYRNRHKRGFECHFCCGCCQPGVCGVCCKF
ncbi:hepcidin-like [Vanacampus margaritifer]